VIHSWREFFEKRQKRNERLKERETPRQRQLREAREKNPPDTNTKVFVWRKDEKGEYRRESFYRAENAKTIGDFGETRSFMMLSQTSGIAVMSLVCHLTMMWMMQTLMRTTFPQTFH